MHNEDEKTDRPSQVGYQAERSRISGRSVDEIMSGAGQNRDRRIFNPNSLEDLKTAVTYQSPTPSKLMAHANLRAGALLFLEAIAANVPECADKTAAMRKVREALFTANAGVALEGLI